MRARFAILLAAGLLALLAVGCESHDRALRIGVVADCEGAVSGLYDVSIGGAELPLLQRGARLAGTRPRDGIEGMAIGGRPVELVLGCAAEQTTGAAELRRLVESEGVEIVIGPNFPPLGLVMTEYARYQPDVTFVVTSWETLTHMSPGANVFRFTLGYLQGTAGLGAYAFHRLGWRRAITIAAPDPFGFGYQAAPVAEFCALGGTISDRVWLDLDPTRMNSQLARAAAADVDGFFVVTAGPEAGVFLEHLATTPRGLRRRVVFNAASLTGLDPALATRLGNELVGAVAVWDFAPLLPSAAAYVEEYRRVLPQVADAADASFHLFDVYYRNGMEAIVQALERVDADISDGQRRFRAALASVQLDAPNGRIRLDANRQAIGSTYMFQVTGNDSGSLRFRMRRTYENVDASFGGRFGPGDPVPDRTQPACEAGDVPAWARVG